jgi:signal-transduction protein with cAMP-binding, CBS, and nucleotidyltransferase domain
VREVARRMRVEGIGCVVVLGDRDAPQGLVTDRDLALRVVAKRRDGATPVAEVMSAPLASVGPGENLQSVARRMSEDGIRRLPVVEAGRLVGLVSYDDLLVALARELHDLGEAAHAAIERTRG